MGVRDLCLDPDEVLVITLEAFAMLRIHFDVDIYDEETRAKSTIREMFDDSEQAATADNDATQW